MLVLCVLFTLYICVFVLFFSSENLNKNTRDGGSTMLTLLLMLTLLKLFTNISVVAYDGLWEPYAVIWMGWDDTPYSQ